MRRRRVLRRAIALAVTAGMLLMGMPGLALARPGVSAAAKGATVLSGSLTISGTTSIAGKVTDSVTGQPIANAEVDVMPDAHQDWFGYATTGADGTYTISQAFNAVGDPVTMPAGGYEVDAYADAYLDTTAHATVVSGAALTFDLALEPMPKTGIVNVSVQDAITHGAVTATDGWTVRAYQMLPSGRLQLAEDAVAWGDTTASQSLELPVGTYYLWAYANGYESQFADGADTTATARAVTVGDGTTDSASFSLAPAAQSTLQVNVKSEASGTALPGIDVGAAVRGPDGDLVDVADEVNTDANGVAVLKVPATPVVIGAYDETATYAMEYYDDAIFPSQAKTVTGSPSTTTTVDMALALGARVQGTNLDKNGAPIRSHSDYGQDVEAYAYDPGMAQWTPVAFENWNVNAGTYSLGGLMPGVAYRFVSYGVDEGATGGPSDFTPAYYDRATSLDTADSVTLSAGQALGNVDFHFGFAAPAYQAVERVYGSNRYATALRISQKNFSSADTVVVATGANYPDALSASGLAGLYGAPLLLTDPNVLSDGVAGEIERLGATNVIIVGGTSAVSAHVADELGAVVGETTPGTRVTRIAGKDRYATSAAVATKMHDDMGSFDNGAFLVRGDDFADALSASPEAYSANMPVLLTSSKTLTPSTASAMKNLKIGDVKIVGSTGAVSSAVETAVKNLNGTGSVNVQRLAGSDRFGTAAAVANWAVDSGTADTSFVGVATGLSFADALGGGVAAGTRGGVLMLTSPTAVNSAWAKFLQDKCTNATYVQVFGGTKVVSDTVKTQIGGLLP